MSAVPIDPAMLDIGAPLQDARALALRLRLPQIVLLGSIASAIFDPLLEVRSNSYSLNSSWDGDMSRVGLITLR